jgi:hypothetical protein
MFTKTIPKDRIGKLRLLLGILKLDIEGEIEMLMPRFLFLVKLCL